MPSFSASPGHAQMTSTKTVVEKKRGPWVRARTREPKKKTRNVLCVALCVNRPDQTRPGHTFFLFLYHYYCLPNQTRACPGSPGFFFFTSPCALSPKLHFLHMHKPISLTSTFAGTCPTEFHSPYFMPYLLSSFWISNIAAI
jgi:hypothetical protein